MDQFYFGTPFAALGDQTPIPLTVQSNGSISFQQGWGPDYALDQTSNPNALPVDRASTNYLMYVLSQAIGALQLTGIPQWIKPADNNGVAVQYPKYSQVRYSATVPGVTFVTYVSVVDNNTSVPGADNNWQPILSIAAAATDVNSATPSSSLTVTPASLQAYAGNAAQTFKVGASTAGNMAPQTSQVQNGAFTYAVATGTANAHTIALVPALTVRTDGMLIRYKAPAANTAGVTLTDGVGTATVLGANHSALQGGEYVTNGDALVMWNSSISGGVYILLECTGGALQVAPAAQTMHAAQKSQAGFQNMQVFTVNGTFTPPTWCNQFKYRAWAGGGGGGGSSNATGSAGGGGGGGYVEGVAACTPGVGVAIVVGALGTGGNTSGTNGATGGTSSVGAIASATGGTGGLGRTSAGSSAGVAGGTGTISSGSGFAVNGNVGFGGLSGQALGGAGGGCYAGSATSPSASGGFGGAYPGGGGGGGYNVSGGAGGGAGLVIIEY